MKRHRKWPAGVFFVFLTGMCLSGCGNERVTQSITGPGPGQNQAPPTQSSGTPVLIVGTVYEHTGGDVRPVPGFPLRIVGGTEHGLHTTVEVVSDSEGHFRVTELAYPSPVWFSVLHSSGYRSPCPPSPWLAFKHGDPFPEYFRKDVHVVNASHLVTYGAPDSIPSDSGFKISGVVTERVGDSVTLASGAQVEMFMGSPPNESDVLAESLTNRDGQYLLCAYHDEYRVFVRARKAGYREAVGEVGWSWTANLELVRE